MNQITIWDYMKSPKENDLEKDLKSGSQFSGGKIRIFALYQHEKDKRVRTEFLKKEYGIGGHSHRLINGENGFVDYDGKGIRIISFRSDYEKLYTWREAEKVIEELIINDKYMTEKDMEKWRTLPCHPYPDPCYRYPPNMEDDDDI